MTGHARTLLLTRTFWKGFRCTLVCVPRPNLGQGTTTRGAGTAHPLPTPGLQHEVTWHQPKGCGGS